MANIEQIQAEMRQALQQHVDEPYLAKISELVPTNWQVIGVRVPQIRAITKELVKANPDADIDDVLALVDDGFQEQVREEALFAIYWLTTQHKEFDLWLWPLIDRWVESIADWEVCDLLATGVAAVVVHKNMELVDQLINWASFPNLWRRRFTAAVGTALNQKGRVHTIETLRICHMLMEDEEKMVQKAAAWALREASKHNQAAVFTFLYGWKKKGQPFIIREGAQKLTAEQRDKLQA